MVDKKKSGPPGQFLIDFVERLRVKLLDLSGRNSLISFRHSERSRRQLRIVDTTLNSAFSLFEDGKPIELKALPLPKSEPLDEQTPEFLAALEKARQEDEDYRAGMSALGETPPIKPALKLEAELRDRVRKTQGLSPINRDQLISKTDHAENLGIHPAFDLPPKTLSKPGRRSRMFQTLLYAEELDRQLSAVYGHASLSESETGLNTLFCAFGFLEWYESEASDKPLYSPLLLYPIELSKELKDEEYVYSVGSREDELSENICLGERLKQDFGLKPLPLKTGELPDAYMGRFEKTVLEKHPTWKVHRYLTGGFFSFAKLAMYHDLSPETISSEGCPLSDLISGTEGGDPGFADDHDVDNPDIREKIKTLITDADASQMSALVDIADGKNLVIEGPPGTGKSQTITNIIAGALSENKTVLFIAEKRAALEVVKSRLDEAGLGDFCLELHSNKTRKTDVLKSLNQSIVNRKKIPSEGELDAVSKDYEKIKETISQYVKTINRKFGGLDKTLYHLLWRFLWLKDENSDFPKGLDDARFENAQSVTDSDLETRKMLLTALEEHRARDLEDYPNVISHPWHGLASPTHGRRDQEKLLELSTVFLTKLRKLTAQMESNPIVGKQLANATIVGVRSFKDSIVGCSKIRDLPVLEEILPQLFERPVREAVIMAINCRKGVKEIEAGVGSKSENSSILFGLEPDDIAGIAECVRELGANETEVGQFNNHVERIQTIKELWDDLADFLKIVNERFDLDIEHTFLTAGWSLAAIKLLHSVKPTILELRRPLLLQIEHAEFLVQAANEFSLLQAKRSIVESNFSSREVSPEKLKHCIEKLTDKSIWRFFSEDYWKARKLYFSVARDPNRIPAAEMAVRLSNMLDYDERLSRMASNARLREVLGDLYSGIETPFKSIIELIMWVGVASERLPAFDKRALALREILFNAKLDKLSGITELAKHPQFERFCEIVSASPDQRKKSIQGQVEAFKRKYDRAKECEKWIIETKLIQNLKLGELDQIRDKLKKRRQLLADIESNQIAKNTLGAVFSSLDELIGQVDSSISFCTTVETLSGFESLRSELIKPGVKKRLLEIQAWASTIEPALAAAETEQIELANLCQDKAILTLSPIENLISRLIQALDHQDELATFVDFLKTEADVEREGLSPVLLSFQKSGLPYKKLAAAYEYTLLGNLLEQAYVTHDHLSRSVGFRFDELRRRFLDLDKQFIELHRRRLRANLLRREVERGVMTGKASELSDLGLITHEISKQRKHLPIRMLLDRAMTATKQLKPCFMMSPLSVAQFITRPGLRFDLVVMDEASQLRPEDALGAVLRGTQVVIVGDPKQLPPTNFFSFSEEVSSPEDQDPDLNMDHESILDLAMKSFQPARRLKWHYRSRHESLISFSNHEFYDGDLIVFPSPHFSHDSYGVKFVPVEGIYESRRNLPEAERLLNEAVSFMEKHPEQSLGLVAVNQEQRDLLSELLHEKAKHDPIVQEFIGRWSKTLQPLFVKNLENVQGDERDAIFISTVYGKDRAGNFFRRFGPINGSMGHRRLNVLFTRAKWQTRVFSSIEPETLLVDGQSSRGLRTLKNFLLYAKTGRYEVIPASESGREPDSDFEVFVLKQLTARGYSVVPQVGVAGYFIDLAVRHPVVPSTYALGIECDGATYHSAKCARDRDKTRQEILTNLGWKIYRIWSTDWFQHTDREIKKLLSALPPIPNSIGGQEVSSN